VRLKLILMLSLVAMIAVSCSNNNAPTEPTASTRSFNGLALAGVPTTATIDSARVFMYVESPDSQTVMVRPVTESWDESALTANSFGGGVGADTLAMFMVADTGWVSLDVASMAQAWFADSMSNYGLVVMPADSGDGFAGFTSREGAANQPYLEICYTTSDGSMCETFTATADAYIDQAQPDSNFGAATMLSVGRDTTAASERWTFARFNFPTFIPPATVGDFVWNDMNMNGIQDADEPGMADVVVRAYTCTDTMVAETMTDADGMYMFDSLMPGDYYFEFVAPENYAFSPMDQGADDAVDSDVDPTTGKTACVTLAADEVNSSIDAGLFLMRASVGDMVWNDMNQNGLQDDGEAGLADIWVYLYGCDDMLMDSTMTDSSGMYLFDNLMPGDYYLAIDYPNGWILTLQNVGDDDAIDSDFDRYRKTTDCFTLAPGEDNTDMDAGLFEFNGCTYGKGYWKNHAGLGPQADVVTPLLLPLYLGDEGGAKTMEVADAQTAFNILQQHYYGEPSNGITKLYAHLLTAKLNITNFANPTDIEDMIADADAFLADHDWTDWDSLSKDDQKMVLKWKGQCESYNEGEIGPGSCGDMDEDHDSDSTDYDHDYDGGDDD